MKYDNVKKKTITEAGIIAVVAVVLSGVIYGLTTISDSYTQENQKLKTDVDGIAAEAKSLETKFRNIQQNLGLYEEIQQKQAQGQLTITRQSLMEKFNQFKTNFLLASLKLSMSAIDESKDATLKRKTSIVNLSEVSVDLEAISDMHIYALIKAIQSDLPGVSGITKMSLAKEKGITEEELRAISQKGPDGLVKGSMKFIWYGINPLDDKVPVAGAGRAPMRPGAPGAAPATTPEAP